MRDLLEETAPQAPSYPSWWLDAIKSSKAVSDALRACQTLSEVDSCAKEHAETFKRLMGHESTWIFAQNMKVNAERRRVELGGSPAPRNIPRAFKGINDRALDAAVADWDAMAAEMRLQPEDDWDGKFYRIFTGKMKKTGWKPTPKEAGIMKQIHMGWQVVEQGVVE